MVGSNGSSVLMKATSCVTQRVILFIREIKGDIDSQAQRPYCEKRIFMILIRSLKWGSAMEGPAGENVDLVKADTVGRSVFVFIGGYGWGFPTTGFCIYLSVSVGFPRTLAYPSRCLLHRFEYHQHAVSYVWPS